MEETKINPSLKLIPFDKAGSDLLISEFNAGHHQLQVFFNKIPPVTFGEINDFFLNKNYFQHKKIPVFNIVDPNGGNKIVGIGGYYNYEPTGNMRNAKLWIAVSQEHYTDYFEKALICLINWGYKKAGLRKIIVESISDASYFARLLQRLAFDKEGELEDYIRINNKWRSVKIYGKIFTEEEETKDEKKATSLTNKEIREVRTLSDDKFNEILGLNEKTG